ncbi:MAG: hypothetical protein HKN67_11245 [Saprospiraceae bacterium]|nr:hypothetical protein [Saprospiraceae bacterium]
MESNTLKDLKILHLALVLGMLVVATLIYFLSDPEMNVLRINLQVDEALALLLAVANLIGVSYFHNKRLPGIQSMDSIEEKWINYRALQIMKYALVEGAGLIAIVIFFGKGNLLLLIIALVLTLTLYLMKPTRERTARDLNLTVEEEAGL